MNLLQFAFAHKVQSILFQKHDTFTFEIKMKNDSGILLPYADIGPDFGEALCKFIFEEWIEGGSHTPFDIKNFISARKEIPSIPINVHLNFMPVYPDGCFDLLLNIKRVSKEQRSLLDLGYSKEHIEVFKNCLNDKKINILISGPSVSGKSTLLKGLVDFANQLNKNQKKVCTIEDPPEFKIDNVSQCPVVRYKEVDYSKFSPMQATYGYAKRFNPEIIMIGEIRNKYDGEILRLAEVEGYKILTSFVASSASGVLTRLTDEFGVNSENFLACYQRFVPKLCPHCAKKLDSDDFEMIEKIKNLCTDKQKVSMGLYPIKKQGSGCSKCGQQGYNGKAICLEMKFEKYKKDGQNNQIQKYLPEQIKGKTILDDAFLKILDGTCSPYDVETYIGGL